MKKAAISPSPVVVTTICSLCELPWEAHGENPTTEDCIRLLKAEMAKRPVAPTVIIGDRWPVPYVSPVPYIPPYVAPLPWWDGHRIIYGTTTTMANIEFRTPTRSALTCSSVVAT